jgi:hypothetical protein
VTEIYPLNGNIFDEDEFYRPVTDRTYCQAAEPASAPLRSKDSKKVGQHLGV